ncbi:MAG: adenylate kinase family protein [Luteolibacter sp.]
MEKFQTYLLVGSPGSGKGTQGQALGMLPGFFHCACGDVFRTLDTTTELGQAFIEYSSKGQLVPDELTVKLWMARIKSNVDSHAFKPDVDFLVLDGIPRNVSQAIEMEKMVSIKGVFNLDCPDEEKIVARLKRRAMKDNRLDDANEEVIRRRLEVYRSESVPLLDHYPAELVTDIDAIQKPHKVMHSILEKILGENEGE